MSQPNLNGLMMNYLMAALYKKVVVPTDFHGQAVAVKMMLSDDVTGIIDALTDFSVESACVDYNIKTKNENLNKILKAWLQNVNSGFKGQIPSGIRELSKEYFKERWKGGSFPILKILKWEYIDNFLLPTQMTFVDGGCVYAKELEEDQETISLLGYEYYLGKELKSNEKLYKNCIITKPFSRWFDKYPVPYLIKRGVYHNFCVIKSLKDKQSELLDQVIPYLMLIRKGSERLAIDKSVNYDDGKLKQVLAQFEELISKMNDIKLDGAKKGKVPIRASQFDEEVEHKIPDMKSMFEKALFEVALMNILAGLGYVDVADAVSSSRRESVLNPKAFIREVNDGVEGFKQILREIVLLIQEKNDSKIKYVNSEFKVTSSPVKDFLTDQFRDHIKALYDRGRISSRLYVEICGETDFDLQKDERAEEDKEGIEYLMYPPVITNQEEKGQDFAGKKKSPQQMDAVTTEDKIRPVNKKNFNKASILIEGLEGSPYSNIADLPDNVKTKLKTVKEKRQWLSTFNSAFNYYNGKFGDKNKAETLAFKTAWGTMK